MRKSKFPVLAVILLVAFLLRLPGLFWGEIQKPGLIVLEPDEYQHLDLTLSYLHKLDPKSFPPQERKRYNSRGLCTQMGLFAYLPSKIFGLETKTLLLVGRGLSIFYGVALVWLVFHFSLKIFPEKSVAYFSAGAMALLDLAVTYSHCAVPEMPYLFWVYFSLFALAKAAWGSGRPLANLRQLNWKWALLALLGMGMTLAMKFDFLPCLVLAILVLAAAFRQKVTWPMVLLLGVLSILGVVFFFRLGIGFQTGWVSIFASLEWLAEENNDLIGEDQHYLYNPLLYLVGTVVGVGLPVSLLAVFSLRKIPRGNLLLQVTGLLLLLEFLLLWKLDAPFVRRSLIFLPAIAILAGLGAWLLLKNGNLGKGFVILAAAYTILLTGISQLNFVNDSRYAAREFLLGEVANGKTVFQDSYARVHSSPPNTAHWQADLIVLHEAWFSRFGKSFTTPFKWPECCEEVYHCPGEELCLFYQNLLKGEAEDFELVKRFSPVEWAPERLIYKQVFGTYETFQGDVLIFERR